MLALSLVHQSQVLRYDDEDHVFELLKRAKLQTRSMPESLAFELELADDDALREVARQIVSGRLLLVLDGAPPRPLDSVSTAIPLLSELRGRHGAH